MLADILDRIPNKPDAAPVPIEVLDYLRANKIPEEIIADLQASSFAEWIPLGNLSLLPMPQLIEQTQEIMQCIEIGYLVLAGGANGDPVAVHRDTKRMVFISHDQLYEGSEGFRECVCETPYLYQDFWQRVVADADFPWDYYEAKRRWPRRIDE